MNNNLQKILIIDYGSQYTQLIARRIRELEVFCLVYPYHKITNKLLKDINPSAFILSGGPKSVLDKNSPKLNELILNKNKPILAICFGMQLITKNLKGKVKKAINREYGHTLINIKKNLLYSKVSIKIDLKSGCHMEIISVRYQSPFLLLHYLIVKLFLLLKI